MKLRGRIPNTYIHVSGSYSYILTIGLPTLLQEYISHSQKHECGNWD
jgi:hypothetical protein